jgi:antitoxin FitA
MCSTCSSVDHMPRMIQVRNVPDELHRTLKIRAAERGMTLSDYLLAELEAIADKPSLAELTERIMQRDPTDLGDSAAQLIRERRGPLP